MATVAAAGGRTRSRMPRLNRDQLTLVLFLGVPLLVYLIWIWIPTVATILISFTRYNNVTAPEFNGIANYQLLFQDRSFRTALVNNLIWLVVFLAVPMTAGLALAVILDRRLRFTRFYQSVVYLPMVLSYPTIGLIFDYFYRPDVGLVNTVLRALNHNGAVPTWLGDPKLALGTILTAAIWRHIGYVMVIFLAGLKGLDPGLRQAASLDGANEWQLFWRITLPSLRQTTVIVL